MLVHLLLLRVYAQEQEPVENGKLVELECVYSAMPWYNMRGGLSKGFVYMDNVDLTAKINLHRLFKTRQNLYMFVYGLGNNGGMATNLMGDYQVASNIQTNKAWHFFEIWVQKNFFHDRLSALVGTYNLNSEFDVLRPGTIFINSSFGMGAEYGNSGLNGPSSFPVTSFGVRLATSVKDHVKLKLAILDGVPGDPSNPRSNAIKLSKKDGAMIAFESSYYPGVTKNLAMSRGYVTRRKKVGREHSMPTDDKINLGGWYYTSKYVNVYDSTMAHGNWGMYAGFQHYWFFSKYDDRYLAFFGRYGVAADRFNRVGSAISGGVLFGASTSDHTDYLGLGFTTALAGQPYINAYRTSKRGETALELTYSFPFRRWLSMQPDLQYIIHPGMNGNIPNPLSFSILFQFTI